MKDLINQINALFGMTQDQTDWVSRVDVIDVITEYFAIHPQGIVEVRGHSLEEVAKALQSLEVQTQDSTDRLEIRALPTGGFQVRSRVCGNDRTIWTWDEDKILSQVRQFLGYFIEPDKKTPEEKSKIKVHIEIPGNLPLENFEEELRNAVLRFSLDG